VKLNGTLALGAIRLVKLSPGVNLNRKISNEKHYAFLCVFTSVIKNNLGLAQLSLRADAFSALANTK
jgi:hypothetical protein